MQASRQKRLMPGKSQTLFASRKPHLCLLNALAQLIAQVWVELMRGVVGRRESCRRVRQGGRFCCRPEVLLLLWLQRFM